MPTVKHGGPGCWWCKVRLQGMQGLQKAHLIQERLDPTNGSLSVSALLSKLSCELLVNIKVCDRDCGPCFLHNFEEHLHVDWRGRHHGGLPLFCYLREGGLHCARRARSAGMEEFAAIFLYCSAGTTNRTCDPALYKAPAFHAMLPSITYNAGRCHKEEQQQVSTTSCHMSGTAVSSRRLT